MVDPDGPEFIEHVLDAETATDVEAGRYSGDDELTVDIGVAEITLVPDRLAD